MDSVNGIKPGMQLFYHKPDDVPVVVVVDEVTDDGIVRFIDGSVEHLGLIQHPLYTPVGLSAETISSFATDRPNIPSAKRVEMDSRRADEAGWMAENDIHHVLDLPPRVEPIRRRGRLLFTIGIARSGKSTWCTRWSQYLEGEGFAYRDLGGKGTGTAKETPIYPRAIVCGDDVRMALHGERFNRHTEPAVWMIHGYSAKSLLSRGHDVILDGTHTTGDSLLRVLNIDVDATCKVFDIDPEICKQRARHAGHHDLVDRGVIDRQYRQLCELKGQDGGIEGVVERVRQRVKDRRGLS